MRTAASRRLVDLIRAQERRSYVVTGAGGGLLAFAEITQASRTPGSVAGACPSLPPSPFDRRSRFAGDGSHRPTLHYSGRLRAKTRPAAAHLDDRLGTASDLGAGTRASRVYPPRKASSVSTRSRRPETGISAAGLLPVGVVAAELHGALTGS